jgi:hypothetical protein
MAEKGKSASDGLEMKSERAAAGEEVSHLNREFRVTNTRRCCLAPGSEECKGAWPSEPLMLRDGFSSWTRNEGRDKRDELQQPPRTASNMKRICRVIICGMH